MSSCIERLFGVGPILVPILGKQIRLILSEDEDNQAGGGGEDGGKPQHQLQM